MVPERDNLSLSYESSEFVLARVGKLAELDAVHLGPDGGSKMGDISALREKIGKGCVGILAVLVVLKRLEWRVLLAAIPRGKIVRIFGGCVPLYASEFGFLVVLGWRDLLVGTSLSIEFEGSNVWGNRDGLNFDCGGGHFGCAREA